MSRIALGTSACGRHASVALLCVLAAVPATAEIELELAFDRTQVLPAEPVVAYLTVTNAGGEAVTIDARLDVELMNVSYLITDPSGGRSRFIPLTLAEVDDRGRSLAPGESVRDAALLHYGSGGWTFPTPGTYAVEALYAGVYSNAVGLEVVEPPTAAGRAAARRLLAEPEVGRFYIYEEGDHLRSAMALLEELAAEPSASPYGRWAAYWLGVAFSKPFADFQAGRRRPADPERALGYLEAAGDELPVFFHQAKRDALLDLNYERLHREPGAGALQVRRRRIAERFPDRQGWREIVREDVERRYR